MLWWKGRSTSTNHQNSVFPWIKEAILLGRQGYGIFLKEKPRNTHLSGTEVKRTPTSNNNNEYIWSVCHVLDSDLSCLYNMISLKPLQYSMPGKYYYSHFVDI